MMKCSPTVVLGLSALVGLAACAAGKVGVTSPTESSGGTTTPETSNGGAGGSGGPVTGVTIDLDAAIPPPEPDASEPDIGPDVNGCKQDDAGNYTCCPRPVSILSLGQPAHYGSKSGNGDNTDAFQAFMNGNTGGTATMQMVKTFKHITDLDLASYDVIILQALEDSEYTGLWSFTAADAAALRDWVHDKGGALITMSGYGNNTTEVQPLNQLLRGSDQWSGVSYNADDTFNSCPTNMCYCAQSSVAFDGWTSNYADFDKITHDLKKVGVYHGRSINCSGADCQIFAKDATNGNVGVAKVYGQGRIFAWGDEWVTYTSQWGLMPDPQYDNAATYPQCVGYSPMTSYTVPQFWYDAFKWLVPWNSCFTIIIPPSAPSGQQIVY
jgi:hypothetical protein